MTALDKSVRNLSGCGPCAPIAELSVGSFLILPLAKPYDVSGTSQCCEESAYPHEIAIRVVVPWGVLYLSGDLSLQIATLGDRTGQQANNLGLRSVTEVLIEAGQTT
jgi:hypothetical protein